MSFKMALGGFKKPSEFFGVCDLAALLFLFFTAGIAVALKLPETAKKLKRVFTALSLLAALPLLIKSLFAVISLVSGSGTRYSSQIINL